MGKRSVEQKEGEGQYWRTAVLNWLVREKGTLEQRFDESEGVGYMDVWEKSIVARSNPKVGMGLKCQRKSNKARMALGGWESGWKGCLRDPGAHHGGLLF